MLKEGITRSGFQKCDFYKIILRAENTDYPDSEVTEDVEHSLRESDIQDNEGLKWTRVSSCCHMVKSYVTTICRVGWWRIDYSWRVQYVLTLCGI